MKRKEWGEWEIFNVVSYLSVWKLLPSFKMVQIAYRWVWYKDHLVFVIDFSIVHRTSLCYLYHTYIFIYKFFKLPILYIGTDSIAHQSAQITSNNNRNWPILPISIPIQRNDNTTNPTPTTIKIKYFFHNPTLKSQLNTE